MSVVIFNTERELCRSNSRWVEKNRARRDDLSSREKVLADSSGTQLSGPL